MKPESETKYIRLKEEKSAGAWLLMTPSWNLKIVYAEQYNMTTSVSKFNQQWNKIQDFLVSNVVINEQFPLSSL